MSELHRTISGNIFKTNIIALRRASSVSGSTVAHVCLKRSCGVVMHLKDSGLRKHRQRLTLSNLSQRISSSPQSPSNATCSLVHEARPKGLGVMRYSDLVMRHELRMSRSEGWRKLDLQQHS